MTPTPLDRLSFLMRIPLGVVLLASVATASDTQTPATLVGTWKLIALESRYDDGTTEDSLGTDPLGQLMYDANGRMSVHLMSRDRPAFASSDLLGGTPEELKLAFNSHQSYYGRYTLNTSDGTVSHQIEGCSFPNWIGSTQTRFFKLDGNRLTLSTPPIPLRGKQARIYLIWLRIN